MSYLHPSRHAVPGGSVSDASMLGKLIDLRVAAGGPGVGHPEVTTLSDEHQGRTLHYGKPGRLYPNVL